MTHIAIVCHITIFNSFFFFHNEQIVTFDYIHLMNIKSIQCFIHVLRFEVQIKKKTKEGKSGLQQGIYFVGILLVHQKYLNNI